MREKREFFNSSHKTDWIFLLVFILSMSFVIGINGFYSQSYPSNVTVTTFRILRYTFNGSTTNFTGLGESALKSLPGVILEKTDYGKVAFNEALNLIEMGGSNSTVNFDRDLNISNDLIYVNNNHLPGIDKSANLSFYNINFTTPVIYHNGGICSDCNFINYSGGVYKFSTPFFNGAYSIQEKASSPVCGNGICEPGENSTTCPIDCGANSGGSGGSSGGGGGAGGNGGPTIPSNTSIPTTGTKEYDFNITPSFIQLKMNKGTYYQEVIHVTDNGTQPLDIAITISGLEYFIYPQLSSFNIQPGQTKDIKFNVFISNSRPADIYVGKIGFTSSHVRKEAKVILQVMPQAALFDVRTTVLKKYLPPAGRVRANVTVINMGDLRNFDIHVLYEAIGFNRQIYTLKEEQFAINQTRSKVLFLDLPKNMSMGTYLFYTKVNYKNVTASSYDTFIVEDVSTASWFLMILIILILMYLSYRYYKSKKRKLILSEMKKKKQEDEIPKPKDLPEEVPKLP